MTTFDAYLETDLDGFTLAHCLEPLGAWGGGDSDAAAQQALAEAIVHRLAWLKALGEPVEAPELVTLQVVERKQALGRLRDGEGAALFDAERTPARAEDVERAIRQLAFQRWEILRSLPNSARAAARVARLARAERAAFRRLKPFPRLPKTVDPTTNAGSTRTLLYEGLRTLNDRERSMVAVRGDGEWTAKRLLRRLVEQEAALMAPRTHG